MEEVDYEIPASIKMQNEYENLTKLSKDARQATVELNQSSAAYRETLSAVNDKLILISLGSVSLLLTFVGVLFSSSRNVAPLNFIYLTVAVILLICSSIALLVSRYYMTKFVFTIRFKFYIQADRDRLKSELKLAQLQDRGITTDHKLMTQKEINKFREDLAGSIELREAEATKSKNKEDFYDKLQKTINILGYLLLFAGYILVLIFFIGVFRILKTPT